MIWFLRFIHREWFLGVLLLTPCRLVNYLGVSVFSASIFLTHVTSLIRTLRDLWTPPLDSGAVLGVQWGPVMKGAVPLPAWCFTCVQTWWGCPWSSREAGADPASFSLWIAGPHAPVAARVASIRPQ